MKPNWFKIVDAVESADEAEVLIYDVIGGFGFSAKDFIDQVKATKAKRLHVRINSPGGETFDGMSIYNYLRGMRGNVRVTVDGIAASMASVIAMAGSNICMAEGSMMMIHNPWGAVMGESSEARKMAELLDKIKDSIVKTYAVRTGRDESEIKAWMDEEKWMTAAEAVELGFADEVDEAESAKSFAMFNLQGFKNLPAGVDIIAQATMNLEQALAEIVTLKATITTISSERDTHLSGLNQTRTDLTTATNRATKAEADLVIANGKVTKVETDLATAKGKVTKLETDLAAEKISVQAKVDEELAKLGQKRLNTGGAAAVDGNTLEEIRAQMQTEKDPVALGRLAIRARELRKTA